MAKLNAPLFSFNASGKLANALVYFGWKGLDVVRSYVIPTNPNTTAQQTQRAYITACVAQIHLSQAHATHPLGSADQVAYAALAAAKGRVMTWFNMVCKLWIDCKILADIPIVYRKGDIYAKTANSLSCNFQIDEETDSQLADGKFWFGSTKTNLIHSKVATVTAGASVSLLNEDCSAFLTAGKKYFVQFKPDADDPCEGANSGIYNFVAE